MKGLFGLLSFLLFSVWANSAFAIKIVSQKNKPKSTLILLDLEKEKIAVGDQISVIGPDQKTAAVLKIRRVKGGRAIATLVNGSIPRNPTLRLATSNRKKSSWGIMAGVSSNTMDLRPTQSTTLTMRGTSISLSGYYNWQMKNRWSTRFFGGYETFEASGTASTSACTGSNQCELKVGYLGFQSILLYDYYQSASMKAWAGAGLGFLFAIQKSSNVIDTDRVTASAPLIASLGLDYRLKSGNYIPIQFDYFLYSDTATTTTSQMILRFGYGFRF